MTSMQIERHIIQSRLAAAIAQRAKVALCEPPMSDLPSREIVVLEAMLLQMDSYGDDAFH